MEHLPSYRDDLYADIQPSYKDSLAHHGILGQKWGVRRFQNTDGSLTSAGKRRYDSDGSESGQKASSNNKQKKKGFKLKPTTKAALASAAAGIGAGAVLYGTGKYLENAANERMRGAEANRRKWYEDFNNARRKAEEERNAREERRNQQKERARQGESKRRGPTESDHRGDKKTSDYEHEYRNSKQSYKDAARYADEMKQRVVQAQREGRLTPDMVDELKRANAARRAAKAREGAAAGVGKATSERRKAERKTSTSSKRRPARSNSSSNTGLALRRAS